MSSGVLSGVLISESLRVGGELSGVPLRVSKIWRGVASSATADQPPHWTLLEFEAAQSDAERLATALAGCLAKDGGWYANFNTDAEAFVVFADQIFRYPRGDRDGRAEATAYARAVGVPEPQLDWAD
jgi:hypothetical protein